ncbi:MAG: DUF3592 domain-containing protein [Holophagales bacterium]|nr:DUF3592 domain-containing protein [Holophagales bacterium]
MSRSSIERRRAARASRAPRWLAWVFCGLFALVGLALLYFMALRPLYQMAMARGWQETTCLIASSRVAASSDGDTFRVEVSYTFELDGLTYEGDRYDFQTGNTSGREAKDRIVKGLPEGAEVRCWVDPHDPESSVISRDPGWFLLWGLFPIPFVLIGVGGLFVLVRMRAAATGGRRRAMDLPEPLPAGGDNSGRWQQAMQKAAEPRDVDADAVMDLVPDPLGHLVLEPASTRKTRVMGLGCLSLLWNGFVAFFLVQSGFFETGGEGLDVFLALVLVPFVLVGLGMIALFVHQLLALSNPLPHLRLTTGRPGPGGQAQLEWHLSGASGRIRRFTIRLEGRESATYTRGTDRVTDHHVFFEQELYDTDHLATSRGSLEVDLPEGLLPTFEAPSNKVGYRIQVRGEIGLWPDVAEDFPFPVYPPDLSGPRDRGWR